MLDLVGIVFASTVVAIDLVAVFSSIRTTLLAKIAAAGLIGLWIGLSVAAALTGELQTQGVRLAMFAIPLVAFGLSIAVSPGVRRAALDIPTPVLIGVNIARIFGFLFLLLSYAHRLSGPFPEFAAWGDMITGVFAVPVAWLAMRDPLRAAKYVVAWNIFGAADLVNAISLAVLSTNGSALQLIHAGPGAAAMATLPWALVPTFLVPFYVVTHGIVFAQAYRGPDRVLQSSQLSY